MKKWFIFTFFSLFYIGTSAADVLDLNTALQNTYKACVGIDDDLHDMKVKAGINTALTGVGTGVGIGAAAAGIAKTSKDKQIENLLKKMEELSNQYKGNKPTDTEKMHL